MSLFGKKNKNAQAKPTQGRTFQTIQQEAYNLIQQMGELEYNYRCIPNQQEELKAKLDQLGVEAKVMQDAARVENEKAAIKAKAAEAAIKAKQPVGAETPQPVGADAPKAS